MQNLPAPDIYDRELQFMPWGNLIQEIEDGLPLIVPENGTVLDLMCGTGALLARLRKRRPDITFTGIDLDGEYIAYARKRCPEVRWVVDDATTWNTTKKFHTIVVTGGLHHVPHEKQEAFLCHVKHLMRDDGYAIIADPYISAYETEAERRRAAIELGAHYLLATKAKGAPTYILQAAIGILCNDVRGTEYKTSLHRMDAIMSRVFSTKSRWKTWPESNEVEYGEYYYIVSK